MSRKQISYGIASLAGAGLLFNIVQIIIILAGGYNRNPAIESPLLQTLDAISLTALWALLCGVIMGIAIRFARR